MKGLAFFTCSVVAWKCGQRTMNALCQAGELSVKKAGRAHMAASPVYAVYKTASVIIVVCLKQP